jgi:hypothetical protein
VFICGKSWNQPFAPQLATGTAEGKGRTSRIMHPSQYTFKAEASPMNAASAFGQKGDYDRSFPERHYACIPGG